MNYSLTVRKEAELDIYTAFEYYENQRLGLGQDFLLCIEECLSKIERKPKHYKNIYKEHRPLLLTPYCLWNTCTQKI